MIIITIADILGFILFGLLALAFLAIWLANKWDAWKARRKAKRGAKK